MKLLDNTKKVADIKVTDDNAIVVARGQGPTFTFPTETTLHKLLADF